MEGISGQSSYSSFLRSAKHLRVIRSFVVPVKNRRTAMPDGVDNNEDSSVSGLVAQSFPYQSDPLVTEHTNLKPRRVEKCHHGCFEWLKFSGFLS